MWQKDSGILYKRWEAVNLHMRMETSGEKESKDRRGRGKWREGWKEQTEAAQSAGDVFDEV